MVSSGLGVRRGVMIAGLASCSVWACGSFGKAKTGGGAEVPQQAEGSLTGGNVSDGGGAPALAGTQWKSDCLVMEGGESGAGAAYIDSYSFAADTSHFEIRTFSDSACTKALTRIEVTGHYVLGQRMPKVGSGVWAVDFTGQKLTATLLDPSNKQVSDPCGEAGAKLAGSSTCNEDDLFQIIAVDQKKLLIGAVSENHNATTSEQRPTELDTEAPFQKAGI